MSLPEITGTELALEMGWDPDRRGAWARDGLLAKPPFREHHAIETAVAAALCRKLNNQRSRVAFAAVSKRLGEHVLAGGQDLWVVVPAKGKAVDLVRGAEAAARAAESSRQPVNLVDLTSAIQQAREYWSERSSTQSVARVELLDERRRQDSA